jgi:hypothetical protein
MKYAVDMDSGAIMCVPSIIKIGSGIQKLIGGITDKHSMVIALAYFYFFEIRKVD